MNASKSKLSLSFWLALAALVVGAWPLYEHLQQIIRYPSTIGDALRGFSFTSYGFGYLQYALLPITEPLLILTALVVNLFVANRIVRALPGLVLALGVVVFFLINLLAIGETDSEGSVWMWTFGPAPESYFYGLAILLSIAAAVAALMNKRSTSGSVGMTGASDRQPVAFDTATGQPIYGYDTNTGAPIY